MSWIKIFLIQSFAIVVLFFGSDYVYTNYFHTDNNQEALYRIRHNIYHHSLRPSFDGVTNWGRYSYRICTDGSGFKSDCANVNTNQKYFDIAFIGDSFTEAIGMPYEDSFVGMVSANNSDLTIANLGVSLYSPTIYRTKIQNFIDSGYIFKHIFVFVDISDIQNESQYFRDTKGNVFRVENDDLSEMSAFKRLRHYIKNNFFLFGTAYKIVKKILISDSKMFKYEDDRDIYNLRLSEWTYNSSSTGYSELGVTGSIKKAIHEMELLYEILEENNIKLSVGVYPWPAQLREMSESKNDNNLQSLIWKEFCFNRCINFIDMFPRYFQLIKNSSVKSVYQSYFINEDVHFNREGNRLIYEAISQSATLE
jgi:lysophospholipase L1-like esterase